MTKRFIALILAVFIMTSFSFTAGAVEEKRAWVDGEKYSLELPKNFDITNEAKLEFMLPFYSNYVTIKTSTPGSTVTFTIDGVSHKIKLAENETKYTFPDVIRKGEKDLYILGNAEITEITFNEIMEEISFDRVYIDTTDYEDATKTALIIREGCSVLKSRTAIRYFDYNNIEVKPVYHKGSIYLPADALCLALEIYWEEDLEKDFFVMRKEQTEVVYIDGATKLGLNNVYKPYEVDVQSFWGKTYVPLRQTAELFGKYVLYKEGFVIVDYRSRARAVADNFFSDLVKEFDEYMNKGIVGKTYYVSTESHASDSNDGSEAHPWATLTKAGKMAEAGDTVIIGGGTYYDLLKPENDGTAAHPITFKAKEGEDVIFSATQVVNNFTEYKDGILVASVPWDMGLGKNQVFYKKKNLVEGRYPNREVGEDGLIEYSNGLRLDPVWITEGDLKVDMKDATKVVSETLLQEEEEDYWKGAVFVSQHGLAWTLCLATVGSSKKGELTLDNTSARWWFAADANPNKGFLTCHINAVDQPGEWTMKDNILYIMPPEGETAETLEVEVKNRHLLADLNDRQYIHLEGIRTFGGSMRMGNSKMCVINNCDMKYISHYTFIEDQRNAYDDGNVYNPNGSPQRGEMGVYISGSDNAFVNSKISFSAATGLFMVGSYSFVDNNVFTELGYGGTSLGAINLDTEMFDSIKRRRGGHTITHNTIKRTARQSFSINRSEGSGWYTAQFLPIELAYNDCSETSICTLDTGTIYMWGSDMGDSLQSSRIHNNFTYEVNPKGSVIHGGIYNDNMMHANEIFDNVQFYAMEGQFKYDVPHEQRKRLFPTSYATVDSWNNIDLAQRTGGKDDLTINDFPSAKPFQVGASFAGYRHNMTYDYYKNGTTGVYGVYDMELSDGVQIINDRIKFTAPDQYVKIKDVDFDSFNTINVVYSADYYKTKDDMLNFYIGESMENLEVELEGIILYPEAKYEDDLNTVWKTLPESLSGVHDVWITAESYGNAEIFQIQLNNRYGVPEGDALDYAKIPCGSFTIAMKGPKGESKPEKQMRDGLSIAIGAWNSNWLKYNNIFIPARVNTLNIDIGSGGQWSGGIVNLRAGSEDGEILATLKVEDLNWGHKQYSVPLNRTITVGTYDFYLTFEGEGSCSDVYWFGFE